MMAEHEPDASTASASEVLSYRQRLEKPAGGEIVLMKWSPTMDLLAATFADNSVRYTHFIFTVRSYLCVFFAIAAQTPLRMRNHLLLHLGSACAFVSR